MKAPAAFFTCLTLISALLACAPTPKSAQPLENKSLENDAGQPPPRWEFVGDTLIYHVQNGRAEELAEIWRPFLEREYGPEIVIVPHKQSNLILIRVGPGTAQRVPPSSAPRR